MLLFGTKFLGADMDTWPAKDKSNSCEILHFRQKCRRFDIASNDQALPVCHRVP